MAALVVYKGRPALAVEKGDRLELTLPDGARVRVRPKDVLWLHPGPASLELNPPEGEEEAAWELLQGQVVDLKDLAELARQRGSLRLVRDGIRLIRAHPALRRIVALSVLADPLPYALLFLFQPYYQLAGTPAALYGLSSAAAAALGALGARSAFGLERRLGALRAFVLANLLPVAGHLAMAGLAGPYLAPLLFLMTYGAMQIRYPLIAALQNRHIASYNRATTISVVSMLEGAHALAMKLVAGYLADIDLRLAFGFLALVPLVAVIRFPLKVEQLESQELSAVEGSDDPRNDD